MFKSLDKLPFFKNNLFNMLVTSPTNSKSKESNKQQEFRVQQAARVKSPTNSKNKRI